ncbi:MAG: superinfection immunity protein [Gemmatimonadaceae bacterium]|nr:superinfection immunity protein [Gemmatimonadaceae bacterium]
MTYIVPMLVPVLVPMIRQLEEPAQRYTGGGLPKGWIMIVISVALYILPSLLAWKNESPRRTKILLINLLLGWTVIGWIVAMIMTFAYVAPPAGETDVPHEPGTGQ